MDLQEEEIKIKAIGKRLIDAVIRDIEPLLIAAGIRVYEGEITEQQAVNIVLRRTA
jgi:cellobiose-specific phosphotransferase system component IIB